MNDRTGAQLLCEALIREGVDVLFGIPGGAIMPFYHALWHYRDRLHHVLCRHEQGAGHAAEGFARASGRVGVCVATSGPGATNLVTPIADAWMDSTPMVAITGQVASQLLGTDAFQEVDITGITAPITKRSYLVRCAEDVPGVVREAFRLARSGRSGPVLVDVTKDAQQARVTLPSELPLSHPQLRPPRIPDAAALEQAAALLAGAERPLILAGNGVIHAGASEALLRLAERTGIPVITTLHGLGAFPQNHALSLGMPGMHGASHVNRAIQRCDVLLNVGSRFDDRVTGRAATFAPRARIIHVDIDSYELGKIVPVTVALLGDARAVLEALVAMTEPGECREWRDEIRQMGRRPRGERDQVADGSERTRECALTPFDVYAALDRAFAIREDYRVVTDVGQHQMWAAQRLTWRRPRSHITSGGAGTMGFAIPAAMGAAIALPDETIWAIVGDGGFQMTNQELATIRQEGLSNVKIAIINNGFLGMVRQWQELFEGKCYSETRLSGPDFARLADAYGVRGMRVERREDATPAIEAAWTHEGPVVIDFRVEQEVNVYPIVPAGASIGEMLGSDEDVAVVP